MSEIAIVVGKRIRAQRQKCGLAQEQLAERSGFHPTYVGQLERGEKNATLESIEKISKALDISLSEMFENLGGKNDIQKEIPLKCYDWLLQKPQAKQAQIYEILMRIDSYVKA